MAAVRRASTPAILVRVLDGSALVGDRATSRLRRGVQLGQRGIVKARADQRIGCGGDQQHRRRDGAQADACGGADAVPVQRDADPAAHHRDVHLSAWDEAKIGVRCACRTGRQPELQDELALGERGAARSRRDLLDWNLAPAVRAENHRDRAGGKHRRHAVGSRRGVAQIPRQRGAALDLGRADQVHRLHHAGIGALQSLVGFQHRARRGGADDEAARLLTYAHDARQTFGVHDQLGLHTARTKLDQEVGAA